MIAKLHPQVILLFRNIFSVIIFSLQRCSFTHKFWDGAATYGGSRNTEVAQRISYLQYKLIKLPLPKNESQSYTEHDKNITNFSTSIFYHRAIVTQDHYLTNLLSNANTIFVMQQPNVQ
jgi:hypothetical protein